MTPPSAGGDRGFADRLAAKAARLAAAAAESNFRARRRDAARWRRADLLWPLLGRDNRRTE